MTIIFHKPELPPDKPNTVFEDIYNKAVMDMKRKRVVELDDIISIINMMQGFEMDVHIAIAGQNGVGKSYVLLMFLKRYLGKKFLDNLLLARHTFNDFIRFILTKENTMLGVDELNQFLSYKEHASDEQRHLISQIELARSRRIGVIGCVRDPRKLTLNYRQGKLSIVIWIIDRYTKGGSYAAVFVVSPSIEAFDRFGFAWIPEDITTVAQIREIFEDMPSFIGYMRIPDAKEGYLTETELSIYKTEKDMAMAYAHIKVVFDRYRKSKITYDDVLDEIRQLGEKFGPVETAKLIDSIPQKTRKINSKQPKHPSADEIEDM
jgi:hypothetical protein